jgi:cytidylate kinase
MDDFSLPTEESRESPRHGFQGDRAPAPPPAAFPAGLTVALSREAGSRGGSIGRRVACKLGWQVYDQELLEYVSQEGPLHQELLDGLPPAAADWLGQRLERLLREQSVSQHPSIVRLARAILALAAQGNVVLIGRGAGLLLPAETTLNVRVVAPLADRIAYLSQWLRLTMEEATERVRLRDVRRAEFLTTHFHRQPSDPQQYDLLLNSSLLGEELCAELIATAARGKNAGRFGTG